MTATLFETDMPGLTVRGKVRDMYDLGDELMIVASDRISAFDVVMKQAVPGKGVVLTQLSRHWFDTLPAAKPHHMLYVVDGERVPPGFEAWRDELRGRAMVCRKARVLPIECVVRGYLVGGGWREYRACGRVSGVHLPPGLRLAERLPEPIFTPSTKATDGHDEPITYDQACDLVGERTLSIARKRSLRLYRQAAEYAAQRGIILADTKFEFGLVDAPGGEELILVDEVLTPDSSRFWPADQWRPGENPPSFDKQYLRDYLESLDWDKTPPPPEIPQNVLEQTAARYAEAYKLLVGPPLRA